uniref:Uncharacterized protein n=1 Tax=Lygus hesperus TaxID=30085 RepID=A0A146KW04_LYGHE
MLSTGRLLRATKLLCDFKTIEGTKKCSFHIYAVNNSSRLRNYVLRRKQQPVAIGFVNFASSDAAAESTANATSQQVLSNSMDDLKVLSELGIIPPFEGAFLGTAPESKNMDDLTSFDGVEVEMRETQNGFGSQGEVMMEMNSGGIPLEQLPVSSQVPELGEHSLLNTVTSPGPPNELKNDFTEVSEHVTDEPDVLLESMFESSIIPEAYSSPLDGSFEPIPSEEDPARTVDQLALETEIDPVPSNPLVEVNWSSYL